MSSSSSSSRNLPIAEPHPPSSMGSNSSSTWPGGRAAARRAPRQPRPPPAPCSVLRAPPARSASRAPPAATSAAGPLLRVVSSARSLSLEEQGKLTADEVDIANLDPREGRELIERMFKAVEVSRTTTSACSTASGTASTFELPQIAAGGHRAPPDRGALQHLSARSLSLPLPPWLGLTQIRWLAAARSRRRAGDPAQAHRVDHSPPPPSHPSSVPSH
ncbi:hypothetical protein PVAP13_4NG002150 [Panicum virgatum]|uniref:Uncharacterized protein n=1 Tax=Panicum virgatum TaxID=38727 RepID=A0A8T0T316_PANVG|nr:hypothetical protein PVAP13_4NG002150 [Panicum virgatum]